MTQKDENLVTWFMLVAGFLLILALAGNSMDFQDRCESQCGKADVITPLVGLQETCFCNEGHGKWRRIDVVDSHD